MSNHFIQCRVRPLKSSEKDSEKYSLLRSLSHDYRMYDESHIDKNLSEKNTVIGCKTKEEFQDKLNDIKKEYKMVSKNSTIDVANYIFTVNKNFFENEKMKERFLKECWRFLEKECGEKSVLSVIGHDDEDGFHVHGYAVPLHNTTRKNRHKEEEKILINYRGKYAHTRTEIVKMMKEKKQQETKTGKLQTRLAEHMKKTFPELKRGISQPGRKHITPKEFRKMIEKKIPEMEERMNTLSTINNNLLDKQEIIKDEKNKLENEITILEAKKNELEEYMKEKKKEMDKMLRNIHPLEVAKLFGERNYPPLATDSSGKQRKIQNSFDYLMYYKKYTFGEAQKFLLDNFPSERFGKTMEEIKDKIPGKKIEKNENKNGNYMEVKTDFVRKTFEALGNPPVRVTITKDKENGMNISRGNSSKKEEMFWNFLDVIDNMPRLNKYNKDGWNVYITPVEFGDFGEKEKKISILIDDVQDPETVEAEIGEANLIIETSYMNYQMVYVVDNPIDYNKSKKEIEKQRMVINEVFKELNNTYGDRKISGLRHCMRLPGFGNKKPGREDFFVKLIKSSPNATHKISDIISNKFKNINHEVPQKITSGIKLVRAKKVSEISIDDSKKLSM